MRYILLDALIPLLTGLALYLVIYAAISYSVGRFLSQYKTEEPGWTTLQVTTSPTQHQTYKLQPAGQP